MKLSLVKITIILTIVAVAITFATAQSDWSQFQKDEVSSGQTAGSAPITAPDNWSQHTANGSSLLEGNYGIDTTPIVAGDYVYTLASNNSGAYLFKYYKNGTAAGGNWPISVGSGGNQLVTPAYSKDGNNVFVVNCQDHGSEELYAINATTGSKTQADTGWSTNPVEVPGPHPIVTPITYHDSGTSSVNDDLLFFGNGYTANADGYACYYAGNGTQKWIFNAAGSNYWAGCAVIGDYIVFGNDSDCLTSLDWTDGSYVDSLSLGGTRQIRSSITWNATNDTYGHIFMTNKTSTGGLSAYVSKIGFNKSTGDIVQSDWTSSSDIDYSTSTPAVYKGRVYVGTGNFTQGADNYLICLDESDLSQEWQGRLNGGAQSSPAISTWYDNGTNNGVYIYLTTNCANGSLYCFKDYAGNSAAGEQWNYTPPSDKLNYTLQGAAISGGYVFFGNDWGYLFGLSNWTRYDFNTARARESPKKAWAFKYQVGNSPGTGDPSEEFNATEYANIRFDDNVYASNQTTTDGYYAAHRFNFSIDDNEESWITKINVTWKGKGDHDRAVATKGAKLYIYNFTSTAYEELDSDTAGPPTEITLTNEKTSSISSYISSSNNVTVLVNQTSAQTSGLGGAEYSYIETDYVKLVVTP